MDRLTEEKRDPVEDEALLEQLGEFLGAVGRKRGKGDRDRHPRDEGDQRKVDGGSQEEVPPVHRAPERQQHDQDDEAVALDEQEALERERENLEVEQAPDDAVQVGQNRRCGRDR